VDAKEVVPARKIQSGIAHAIVEALVVADLLAATWIEVIPRFPAGTPRPRLAGVVFPVALTFDTEILMVERVSGNVRAGPLVARRVRIFHFGERVQRLSTAIRAQTERVEELGGRVTNVRVRI